MLDAAGASARRLLCRGQTCSLPVTAPAALIDLARGQSS